MKKKKLLKLPQKEDLSSDEHVHTEFDLENDYEESKKIKKDISKDVSEEDIQKNLDLSD